MVDVPREDILEDSDGDGLADIFELAGAIDRECDGIIDVRIDGADPHKADLFVEVDCEDAWDRDGDGKIQQDERVCPEEYAV